MRYENISAMHIPHWTQLTLNVPSSSEPKHARFYNRIRESLNTHDSPGRYNYNPIALGSNDTFDIMFELEEDATYFALKFTL